jgi:hypothetical protein
MANPARTGANWGIVSRGRGWFKAIPWARESDWNEELWRRKKSENNEGGTCPNVPVEFRTMQLLAWTRTIAIIVAFKLGPDCIYTLRRGYDS